MSERKKKGVPVAAGAAAQPRAGAIRPAGALNPPKPGIVEGGRDAHRKVDRHRAKRERKRSYLLKQRLSREAKTVRKGRKQNRQHGKQYASNDLGDGPLGPCCAKGRQCEIVGHGHSTKTPSTGRARRLKERNGGNKSGTRRRPKYHECTHGLTGAACDCDFTEQEHYHRPGQHLHSPETIAYLLAKSEEFLRKNPDEERFRLDEQGAVIDTWAPRQAHVDPDVAAFAEELEEPVHPELPAKASTIPDPGVGEYWVEVFGKKGTSKNEGTPMQPATHPAKAAEEQKAKDGDQPPALVPLTRMTKSVARTPAVPAVVAGASVSADTVVAAERPEQAAEEAKAEDATGESAKSPTAVAVVEQPVQATDMKAEGVEKAPDPTPTVALKGTHPDSVLVRHREYLRDEGGSWTSATHAPTNADATLGPVTDHPEQSGDEALVSDVMHTEERVIFFNGASASLERSTLEKLMDNLGQLLGQQRVSFMEDIGGAAQAKGAMHGAVNRELTYDVTVFGMPLWIGGRRDRQQTAFVQDRWTHGAKAKVFTRLLSELEMDGHLKERRAVDNGGNSFESFLTASHHFVRKHALYERWRAEMDVVLNTLIYFVNRRTIEEVKILSARSSTKSLDFQNSVPFRTSRNVEPFSASERPKRRLPSYAAFVMATTSVCFMASRISRRV